MSNSTFNAAAFIIFCVLGYFYSVECDEKRAEEVQKTEIIQTVNR